ncbi:cob(I)yrinic acid a,c-diamide adenosyltransferase [Acetobacter fabarum]|jgi:cob(I)alamin adenosyltransferase|uniref:Corrinoid adenosyltransferase n=1 Tax=Acetobacter fabarum TaxID=483199 RepID=A0A269Y2B5_9PROT|nr:MULTISPECIES: cob(I)yrinic acid a,c-diamide adenosyltransferase [Acetobacter]MDN6714628.1 cob(I)yrinic acid a,c-diamide adenosyltransferase [Acetobacter sp.]MCH4027125.1 cob(I)yrinic acid a,c-diamide adenosyltransferase [Acetobacter fabarum]MCH4055386.1 cob(I)yrinic acid a,c-diamide adenosyltransferase [Acetobacter fabarum]MCH4085013.1 cob(I)yrinic acid a,c-diamide adenosyltransferase [Acetobacter fabarum]MCH4127781.1 cob(I)yrinic acid a,c-diamide adenosyltransferase [Acetobacter fabarum]
MSIRIDKIVTRGGDGGQTSLGDGSRVTKDDVRIEVLGTLDEINALVGLVQAHTPAGDSIAQQLTAVQNLLFDMGADVCLPEDGPMAERAHRVEEAALLVLERRIEELRARQSPLNGFVLPGGSVPAAMAHMTRTQVRRAERRMVALSRAERVNPVLLKILNRLSDYFFVLARHFNHDGQTDVVWQPVPKGEK